MVKAFIEICLLPFIALLAIAQTAQAKDWPKITIATTAAYMPYNGTDASGKPIGYFRLMTVVKPSLLVSIMAISKVALPLFHLPLKPYGSFGMPKKFVSSLRFLLRS